MLGFASRSTTAGTVVLLDAADCSVLGTVDYGEGVTGIQITDEGRVLSYVDDWYDMTDLPLAPPVESCR
jgi:Ethanolamine utilization protein EutJ (predicted chaperonin)